MANEMLPHTQRAEGAAMLEQYAAVIVVTAKINTCVAFGDTRAADRLSKELFH